MYKQPRFLLSEFQKHGFICLDFLLQLQQAIQQTFRCGWATRNIDINGYNAIATSHDSVGIMIVASTIGTGTHGNHPTRVGHLVVYFPQRWRHLVSQCPRHHHDIGLTGRCTKHQPHALHIVSGHGGMDHFHRATSKSKGHWPQRTLSGPVDDIIQFGHHIFCEL